MTVFAEAINFTGNSRRAYARTTNNVIFVIPGYARYAAGLRVNFGESGPGRCHRRRRRPRCRRRRRRRRPRPVPTGR